MFRCDKCKKITKPGEKQHKKVIQTRKKEYHNEDKWGNDKVSVGYETVKEINLCEKCAEKENVENDHSKSR